MSTPSAVPLYNQSLSWKEVRHAGNPLDNGWTLKKGLAAIPAGRRISLRCTPADLSLCESC